MTTYRKLSNRKISKLCKRIEKKRHIARSYKLQSLYLTLECRLMMMHPDGSYFDHSLETWRQNMETARRCYKTFSEIELKAQQVRPRMLNIH